MNSFSTYFKDKNDQNDFYIAMFVIVLALGCGVFYSLNLFDSQQLLSSAFSGDMETENHLITDKNSGFQFENKADKAFTTVLLNDKKNIQQVDKWLETSDNRDTLVQVEEDNAHLLIENMIDSLEANNEKQLITNEAQEDTTTISQLNTKEDTIESVSDTTASPTTEKISIKEIEIKQPKHSDTQINNSNDASISSNCVIVVGAFSLADNADKLKRALIKKGYPAYTFFRKGNKVVGIKQSCDDTKAINKMLKQIQAKYNSSAWILKNK